MPTTVPKRFVKGGDTRFYRYPREPENQEWWILAANRHNWVPTEHARTVLSENCPHTTALEVVVSKRPVVPACIDLAWNLKICTRQ